MTEEADTAPAEVVTDAAVRPPRDRPADLAAVGSYVLGALFITIRLIAHLGGRLPVAAGDRIQSEYFLSFAARIITHGVSPFYTGQMNAPFGVNTLANTSILGLGIPMAPVTLLFGASTTFDLLIVIGIAGTAAAWYWLLSRHLVRSRTAAWVGGLFGGFAPSVISHAAFHPNLVAQFLVPFIVWRAFRLLEPGRWLRNGLALAGLVIYQVFINEEMLFLTGLAVAGFLILCGLQRRDQVRAALKPLAAGLAVAVAASLVVLAYPLWEQFNGPGAYHGGDQVMTTFRMDVLGLTTFASNSIAARWSAFGPPTQPLGAEEHGYFGWPLVLLILTLVVWQWRTLLVRCAALTAAAFAVLAWGSPLKLQGKTIDVPGPYAILKHLPLFDTLLPTRLGEVTTWALVPVLALGVQRLVDLPRLPGETVLWHRRLLMIGAFAAALVPAAPMPIAVIHRPPVPAFITSGQWRSYVAPDQSVLVVPLPTWDTYVGLEWSSYTRLDLKLNHGYFLGPAGGVKGNHATSAAPPRPTDKLIEEAMYGTAVPAVTAVDRAQARTDLAYWHTAVVLCPNDVSTAQDRALMEALIGPPQLVGGVWLWDVRNLR
jgi:hypothetical protein